jgi:hypothetical protein
VRFAETISSAGNDLLVLINDILDLSKIEAGRFEIHAEPVPVARSVEEIARSLRPIARQKGLSFKASVAPEAPSKIDTDAARLGQILKNLVSNAIKFTDKGEVTLRAQPGADGGVAFVVRDTGIGIPSEQHEVIFEAFRQAGRQHPPSIRRHGAGPVDIPRPGSPARRRHRGRERAGNGQRLHADAAPRPTPNRRRRKARRAPGTTARRSRPPPPAPFAPRRPRSPSPSRALRSQPSATIANA